MKHTALYLRVSTEAQADEGYSLAAQAEKLEAYCRMKGLDAFRRYVDGGFSGSNLSRPAITELVEHIRSGRTMDQIGRVRVSEIMDESFPTVSESASMGALSSMLATADAVLVTRKGKIVGLVTSADMLKLV